MKTEAEKLKQETRDAKEEKERMEIKLIDVQERLKFLETEKGKFEGNFFHYRKININFQFNVHNKIISRQVIRNISSSKNKL